MSKINVHFFNRLITLILVLIFSIVFFAINNRTFASTSYTLTPTVDKLTVNKSEKFSITLSVKNNTNKNITDFEIRSPFSIYLSDSTLDNTEPSFNKLLNAGEYPSGFQNRGWIINNFEAGSTRTFRLDYSVSSNPQIPTGIESYFTLPGNWTDPRALPANIVLRYNSLRFDVYITGTYSASFDSPLPKLNYTETELSNLKLDSKFLFEGSRTTDLKQITTENITSFSNFVLETSDALLEWQTPLNLSSPEVITSFNNLHNLITTSKGIVSFNGDLLSFLNAPVKVTLKDNTFVLEPRIKYGDAVFNLAEKSAVWDKTSGETTVDIPFLINLALSPSIETESNIIQTSNTQIRIRGKVSNPRAINYYKVDDGDQKNINRIDLTTGEFDFSVNEANKIKKIEIFTEYTNSEKASKIIEVQFSTNTQPTVPQTTVTQNNTISLNQNPITLALIIAAISITFIIGGYVYYLYYRKNKMRVRGGNNDFFSLNKDKKDKDEATRLTNSEYLLPEADLKNTATQLKNKPVLTRDNKYENLNSNQEKSTKTKEDISISIKTSQKDKKTNKT